MSKKLLLFISLIAATQSFAQDKTAEVKVNIPAGCITIFNPALEVGFAKQSALVFEYVGAFAEESFMGSGQPFLFSMPMFSYRHYIKKGSREGFFAGGDLGITLYRMEKNAIPLVANDHGAGVYDVGHGYVLGATVGYKRFIGDRFSIEASISGGYTHSRHEMYYPEGYRKYFFNGTYEWTLYKGGIYLGYRLWK